MKQKKLHRINSRKTTQRRDGGNKMAVNVAMDNPMAMMYDIFKAAGKRFIEEA